MQTRSIILLLTLICIGTTTLAGSLCGQTEKNSADSRTDDAVDKVEMLTFKVLVVDPHGAPVEDAEIAVWGMHAKVEDSTLYRWQPNDVGQQTRLKSDSQGLIEMQYPRFVAKDVETGAICMCISHPGFVFFNGAVSVEGDPPSVQLETGFRVALNAIDGETGEPIINDLYGVINNDHRAELWKNHGNGTLVSPAYVKDSSLLRVVKITPGQPMMFSELINIDPEEKSRVLLKDVKLFPGTRVEGKIDESVPRPVKNGRVAIYVEHTNEEFRDYPLKSWTWSDCGAIEEDGSFAFDTLPRGEVLQVAATCDGWVSQPPTVDSVREFFPEEPARVGSSSGQGQLVGLQKEVVRPVLPMNPSTTLRVLVVDEDENPLPDAIVEMSPNTNWFPSGSILLGTASYSKPQALVAGRRGEAINWPRSENPFTATTDSGGIAIVRNLPSDCNQVLVVSHEKHEMQVDRGEFLHVQLQIAEQNEYTVPMRKRADKEPDR